MTLLHIGDVVSWSQAFDRARKFLIKDQLTAVAIVPEHEYAEGNYFATHLDEFTPIFGAIDSVLDNLAETSRMLYPGATTFRLMHGAARYPRPEGVIDGWMFIIVYNN